MKFNNREEVKDFLEGYENLRKRVRLLNARRELVCERMENVKSPNMSGMPPNGERYGIAEALADKSAIDAQIETAGKAAAERYDAITALCEGMEDAQRAYIIESRYLDLRSFKEIAGDLSFGVRWVQASHRKAIESLVGKSV